MTTPRRTSRSAAEEIERLRLEQGQQFLKQMQDMFQQTRHDLAQQFVPRTEWERGMGDLTHNVEKLTQSVLTLQERLPEAFVPRREFASAYDDSKSDRGGIRSEMVALRQKFDDFEHTTEMRWSKLNERIGESRLESTREVASSRFALDGRTIGGVYMVASAAVGGIIGHFLR